MNTPFVSYNVEDKIAHIEFFHPSHNSLPSQMLQELVREIERAGNDKRVVLIVLKSKGERSFCAGANFEELRAIKNEGDGKQFFMGFANLINSMRKCPKIIVGRVQGKAVGGGVGIAAATDYCMATKYASVRLSELAIGIGPFVIGPAVERKLGLAAFQKLSLNPEEWQTAAWAKDHGLYQEVFDSNEQLNRYIIYYAEHISKMNPLAMMELKKISWRGTEKWDSLLADRAALSGRLILSEFAQAAIRTKK